MAREGAVRWMFERKGAIIISLENKNKEEMEFLLIDGGAEDFKEEDGVFLIYTKPENLETTKNLLEEKGVKIESSSLEWVAKESISLSGREKEALEKLFEALDENDGVQDVYSNLKYDNSGN